ncbi:MAG: hypothetical protein QOH86_2149, partial [Sphingomonadales bacterium]|nr:hypothetical protein [Sphingomonadales bacterium]
MKLSGLAAAAAILVTSLGLAAAADAQPPVRERTVVRTTDDARPMRERTVVRTTVVRRDMDRRHYGWERGRHYGWRNHQRTCRTVWRHHRRIRT